MTSQQVKEFLNLNRSNARKDSDIHSGTKQEIREGIANYSGKNPGNVRKNLPKYLWVEAVNTCMLH